MHLQPPTGSLEKSTPWMQAGLRLNLHAARLQRLGGAPEQRYTDEASDGRRAHGAHADDLPHVAGARAREARANKGEEHLQRRKVEGDVVEFDGHRRGLEAHLGDAVVADRPGIAGGGQRASVSGQRTPS